MDLGFALAGFQPVWVNEIDPIAAKTHEALFSDLARERKHLATSAEISVGDILQTAQSDLSRLSDADLVIGGPPCQGFSVAGKMDPEDQRSQHVFHFLSVVDRVQPKVFVMENVKALYQNQRFSLIRSKLVTEAEQMGYSTKLMLLNAAHYGVPQSRERMIFIGIKGNNPLTPKTTTEHCPPTLRELLATLPPVGQPGNDELCPAIVTPLKKPILRKSPYAGMLFNGRGRAMNLEAPAATLSASMGGNKTPVVDQLAIDDHAKPWIVEYHSYLQQGNEPVTEIPKRMRRLSIQEAAAIQTFPAWTRWQGSTTAKFRQIGNAVPPRLAYAIAEQIKHQIN